MTQASGRAGPPSPRRHHRSSFARICLDEATNWAAARETFDKKLGHHQAVHIKPSSDCTAKCAWSP